jgi:hypothetical protein
MAKTTTKTMPMPMAPEEEDLLKRFAASPMLCVESLRFPRRDCTFGLIMAEHQREWLRVLSPAFLALARGERPPSPRVWIEASKGSAKDGILAALVLWLAKFTGVPIAGQIAAVDRDNADETCKAMSDWKWANPKLFAEIDLQAYRVVRVLPRDNPNNVPQVEITVVASDIAGSHGARPDLLVINEAHAINKWEFVENLLDNASKMPNGLVCVLTNAGIVDSPPWKLREQARTSDRWSFHQYDRPAPWIDEAELADARARNSASRFARLFYGQWVHGGGDAIDPQDIAKAMTQQGRFPCYYEEYAPFVAGLDLGLKRDRSALVTLACDPVRDRIHLVDCQAWNPADHPGGELPLEIVERACLETVKKYNIEAIMYDEWEARYLAQRLRDYGVRMIPFRYSNQSLDVMATTLLSSFRERRVVLYNDPDFIADLHQLSIVDRPGSGYRLQAPRNAAGHADRAYAFASALPLALDWMQQTKYDFGGLTVEQIRV